MRIKRLVSLLLLCGILLSAIPTSTVEAATPKLRTKNLDIALGIKGDTYKLFKKLPSNAVVTYTTSPYKGSDGRLVYDVSSKGILTITEDLRYGEFSRRKVTLTVKYGNVTRVYNCIVCVYGPQYTAEELNENFMEIVPQAVESMPEIFYIEDCYDSRWFEDTYQYCGGWSQPEYDRGYKDYVEAVNVNAYLQPEQLEYENKDEYFTRMRLYYNITNNTCISLLNYSGRYIDLKETLSTAINTKKGMYTVNCIERIGAASFREVDWGKIQFTSPKTHYDEWITTNLSDGVAKSTEMYKQLTSKKY